MRAPSSLPTQLSTTTTPTTTIDTVATTTGLPTLGLPTLAVTAHAAGPHHTSHHIPPQLLQSTPELPSSQDLATQHHRTSRVSLTRAFERLNNARMYILYHKAPVKSKLRTLPHK
jgi:hypothetical protein